jgi:hypothetical protein
MFSLLFLLSIFMNSSDKYHHITLSLVIMIAHSLLGILLGIWINIGQVQQANPFP